MGSGDPVRSTLEGERDRDCVGNGDGEMSLKCALSLYPIELIIELAVYIYTYLTQLFCLLRYRTKHIVIYVNTLVP